MKKTMFITSVIMVVVMAIALTTSSLAWFSAQGEASVSTNAVEISARSNVSSGLYIARDTAHFGPDSIDLEPGVIEINGSNQGHGIYAPVVPYGQDNANTQANFLYALQNYKFVGNTTKVAQGQDLWAGEYSSDIDQVYCLEDLYVANSGNKDIKVRAGISIAEAHGATLNVAVLVRHEDNLLPKINGDVNNNGVIDGEIGYMEDTNNTPENEDDDTFVPVATYVGRVGIKEAGVYGEYIDANGDHQIDGLEVTTVEAYLAANTTYVLRGEEYNSEEAGDYTARDYVAATTANWEILAFKNSANGDKTFLGKYTDEPIYKIVMVEELVTNPAFNPELEVSDDNPEQVMGEVAYYELDDAVDPDAENTLIKVASFEADYATYLEENNIDDPADGPERVRSDVAGQNNYFEENAGVHDAYDEDGLTIAPNAKTSFTLRGTVQQYNAQGSLVSESNGDYMQVRVIAWYSVDLTNENSGKYDATNRPTGSTASFTITFTEESI